MSTVAVRALALRLRPPRAAAAGVRSGRVAPALGPLALAIAVGWITASDGGYFPSAWGWGALAFAWIAALALVFRPALALGALEKAALGALVALTCWIFASLLWTTVSPTQSVPEGQRALVYVAGLAAVLLVVRRSSVGLLLGGTLAAAFAVSGWALLTRTLPERVSSFDLFARYRLAEPLGYWNALGIVAVLGIVLALGLAARARGRAGRAAAAATLPLLSATLTFTFSRGAWIGLAVGLVVLLACEPRRLQLVTTALVLAGPAAAAVWLSAGSRALVRQDALLPEASRDGHRVLALLTILVILSGSLAALLARAERELELSRKVRRSYAVALLVLSVAALLAVFARYGSPVTIAKSAYHAFVTEPPVTGVDLSRRLFSFSGNGRPYLWRAAWNDYKAHPWLGSGAGSYERYWLQQRPVAMKVGDAHNLYLEMLAELGPVGLGLLAAALGLPLVAAVRARRRPLVPAALGAYAAYLLHAGADWHWEMTGATLTALFCAGALLVSARTKPPRPAGARTRTAALAGILAVAALAVAGLLGNLALQRSIHSARVGDWASSAEWARRAERYAPWSSEPWRRLALAQAHVKDARPFFRRAIAKDERNWVLWFELAWASEGHARQHAITQAARLNPLSPELARFRAYLRRAGR